MKTTKSLFYVAILCLSVSILNAQTRPKQPIKNETTTNHIQKTTQTLLKNYNFSSIFLKGDYVEIGIHPAGSFGTDVATPTPPGYHDTWTFWSNPSITDYLIGFNCDINKDGYDLGEPQYMGDYFVPGAPLEGWGIEWNIGNESKNFLNFGAIADYDETDFFDIQTIEFQNLSTENVSIAEWKGEAINGEEKLQVTQTVRLRKEDTYFTIEITLKNTGSVALDSVEYFRSVDPDNETRLTAFLGYEPVTESDTAYCTYNYVTHQPGINGNADTAKVYAEGTKYRAPLILGTIDSRAKVTVGGAVNLQQLLLDPDDILNSTNEPTINNPKYGDYQIGIAFRVGTLLPGQCTSFVYYYNMENLQSSQIVFPLTADFIVQTQCSNLVNFADASWGIGANSVYIWLWDFDNDGITDSTGRFVSHLFAEPGTYPVTLTVELCDGTIQQVTKNVTISYIPNFSLPDDITICEGDNIQLDAGEGYTNYLWNTGDSTQMITVSDSGMYIVNVENIDGCSATDSIYVSLFPKPQFTLTGESTVCSGEAVQISAFEQYSTKFNGGIDGIEFKNFPDLGKNFTISVFLRITSSDAFQNYGGIIARGTGNDNNNLDFTLYLWQDGKVRLKFIDELNQTHEIISNTALSLNTDYNIVALISTSQQSIYINGIQEANGSNLVNLRYSSNTLNIGRQLSEAYNEDLGCMALNGNISQVKIWNKIFNNTQIEELYNQTYRYADTTNLFACIKFIEGKGKLVNEFINNTTGYFKGFTRWNSIIPFENNLMNGLSAIWLPTNQTGSCITVYPTGNSIYTCIVSNEYCAEAKSVTINVNPMQNVSLGGSVVFSGGGLANATVKRYILSGNGTYQYFAPMVITDNNGNFLFPNTIPGTYILQVIASNMPQLKMTYYDSTHHWKLATPIVLNGCDNQDVVIHMREKLQKNNTIIDGYTFYNDNSTKNFGIQKAAHKSGNPATGVLIVLNQSIQNPFNLEDERTYQKSYDATISDLEGFYKFENVDFNAYINYPSLENFPDLDTEFYNIMLNSNNLYAGNRNFEIDTIAGIILNQNCKEIIENNILFYPNPLIGDYGELIINNNVIKIQEITIFNSYGQKISEIKNIDSNYQQKISLEFPKPAGIYLLKLKSDKKDYTLKILKQKQ